MDRLIRIWRGKEDADIVSRPPWAQRMIQLELSLMYFATFCWKAKGAPWLQGTAMFYIYHLDEFRRLPTVPLASGAHHAQARKVAVLILILAGVLWGGLPLQSCYSSACCCISALNTR